jgi:uncharacterized protein (UPF0332 family)
MSFIWDHYLELAERLLALPSGVTDGEAYWRSAISRAYYAAFHESRVYLQDPEIRHGAVASTLRDRRSRKDKRLAVDYKELKALRGYADYDESPPVPINSEAAQTAIDYAKSFIGIARGEITRF